MSKKGDMNIGPPPTLPLYTLLLGDQLNMAMFFAGLKSDASVRYWTSQVLQGIRKTRPYLTGHSVHKLRALPIMYTSNSVEKRR